MSRLYWSEVKGKKQLRSSRRGAGEEILRVLHVRLFIKELDCIHLCRKKVSDLLWSTRR
jgi:hypothetical protein